MGQTGHNLGLDASKREARCVRFLLLSWPSTQSDPVRARSPLLRNSTRFKETIPQTPLSLGWVLEKERGASSLFFSPWLCWIRGGYFSFSLVLFGFTKLRSFIPSSQISPFFLAPVGFSPLRVDDFFRELFSWFFKFGGYLCCDCFFYVGRKELGFS